MRKFLTLATAVVFLGSVSMAGAQQQVKPVGAKVTPTSSSNSCGAVGEKRGFTNFQGCIGFYTKAGWSQSESSYGCSKSCRQ